MRHTSFSTSRSPRKRPALNLQRVAIIAAVISLFLPGVHAQKTDGSEALRLFREADRAYRQKDYAAYLENLEKARRLAPGHPSLKFAIARANALLGKKKESLEWLNQLAQTGLYFDIARHEDLKSLRGDEEFASLVKRFDKAKAPAGNSSVAFTLSEKDLIPESVAYDPVKDAFYVGSIYRRKIVVRDKSGATRDFAASGRDGLWGVLGIKIDPKRRLLWANACNLGPNMPMIEPDEAAVGQTAVFKYDLDSGRLIKKYAAGSKSEPHCFNDLVINSQGDVFITVGPPVAAVYMIDHRKDELETFFKSEHLSPNGLALSEDDRTLFVTNHILGVMSIDVKTRQAFLLPSPDDTTLIGIDGLYVYKKSLVAVQNGLSLPRIMQFFLNEEMDRVTGARVLEINNPRFDIPTTGVVVGDELYYVANSQIRAFNQDGTIFPSEKLREPVILKTKLN